MMVQNEQRERSTSPVGCDPTVADCFWDDENLAAEAEWREASDECGIPPECLEDAPSLNSRLRQQDSEDLPVERVHELNADPQSKKSRDDPRPQDSRALAPILPSGPTVSNPVAPVPGTAVVSAGTQPRRFATTLEAALSYLRDGISCFPFTTDGKKVPIVRWTPYMKRMPTEAEVREWFKDEGRHGIAWVCGRVSGSLTVLDFDEEGFFEPWALEVERRAPGLVARLPLHRTPSGLVHLPFRSFPCEGSQVFARIPNPAWRPGMTEDKKVLVAIETKGERGCIAAPGSPPAAHHLNKPYTIERDVPIPYLSEEEVEVLFDVARSFNQVREPEPKPRVFDAREKDPDRNLPGDDFNARAEWEDILEPKGWSVARFDGGVTYWTRPGKEVQQGHSATTGYCAVDEGETDLLYVFSSSALPFEANSAYSKFAAYTLLNHDGDFSAAKPTVKLGSSQKPP